MANFSGFCPQQSERIYDDESFEVFQKVFCSLFCLCPTRALLISAHLSLHFFVSTVQHCTTKNMATEYINADNNDGVERARQPPAVHTAAAAANRSGNNANFMRFPTLAHEQNHVTTTHGAESWQAQVLHFIHRNSVTYFLCGLLLSDVFILFAELYLTAEFPSCNLVERDAISCCEAGANGNDDHAAVRLLNDAAGEEDHNHNFCEMGYPSDYMAGCNPHQYPGVHTTHLVLQSMTLVILSIFSCELFLLMAAMGVRAFFSNIYYCFDLFVVVTSLVLEIVVMTLQDGQVEIFIGLLVFGRIWRFIRIGHGIFEATHELTAQKLEKEQHRVMQLDAFIRDHGLIPPDRLNVAE